MRISIAERQPHPDMPKQAVRLLRRVKCNILAKPQKFDMGQWLMTWDKKQLKAAVKEEGKTVAQHYVPSPRMLDNNACGTVGCLAGHCLIIGATAAERKAMMSIDDNIVVGDNKVVRVNYYRMPDRPADEAARKLGLTKNVAQRLFFLDVWGGMGWPADYSDAYNDATTPARAARVAAARIEHFIATME